MKFTQQVSLMLFLGLVPWACGSDESGGNSTPATGGTGATTSGGSGGGGAGGGNAGTGATSSGGTGNAGTGGSAGTSTAGTGGAVDAGSDVETFVYGPCEDACATNAQVCSQTPMEEADCVEGCTNGTFDMDCGELLKTFLDCVNMTPQNVVCEGGMGRNPDCDTEGGAFAACDSP